MPAMTIDQRHLQTLGQLLSAGGHQDVPGLLRASLERLVAFWPAQAGALIYQAPHDELLAIESGTLNQDAARLIAEAREAFTRRAEGSEPAIGYYALDDDLQLMELSLRSGNQTVGLLHLVVRESDVERSESTRAGEDMVVLLVRALQPTAGAATASIVAMLPVTTRAAAAAAARAERCTREFIEGCSLPTWAGSWSVVEPGSAPDRHPRAAMLRVCRP